MAISAFFNQMMQSRIEKLRQKAAMLPPCPGVYLMKGKDGGILYVGKSRCLPNRVASYFTGNRHSAKTAQLVARIEDFDTVVCESEMEALSLENTLIKRHTPRYNIKLKDAKSYPYILMTEEVYPRLLVTRKRGARGRYFGPYPGAADARSNAETVSRVFGLLLCRHRFPEETGRVRPCLYRQMGRCAAPCAGDTSPAEYRKLTEGAAEVLSGNVRRIKASLQEEMLRLAEEEQFEAAARLRDRIAALDGLGGKQKAVGVQGEDTDVWAMIATELCGALAVLTVRDGSLVLKNEFTFPRTEILDEDGAITFIADYYADKEEAPPAILLDFDPGEEGISLLGDYLSHTLGRKVTVRLPKRGQKSDLCRMARKNAEEAANKLSAATMREDKTLCHLAELLGLACLPDRIEAMDISNLGAEFPTASLVVWENGRLAKNRYRLFRIRESVQDDYAAMREVLTRRFTHEGEEFGELPELLLLDGGAGQVAVGKEVLRSLGLSIPVFGMVKDDFHKTRALTDGEGEISIAQKQDLYTFIYNLQEEAHRFAVSRMMGAKRKSLKHSVLEEIPGVGKARAKQLLKAFTIKALAKAEPEAIVREAKVPLPVANAIWTHFQNKK